jgi:NAD(P)H dehydrogenase (quinone)
MKTLIIYAHPETKSHCSVILEEVQKRLDHFEVLDLYKIGYNPILGESELYTSGNSDVDKQTKIIQEKIKQADHLVFIYPVWWGTMPAILKGFFEKVLTPGFAYKFENKMPKKLLDKQATVLMTLGGPKIYSLITGNLPKKHIKKSILGFCGIKAKVYQLFNCNDFNDKKSEEIKNLVRKTFS